MAWSFDIGSPMVMERGDAVGGGGEAVGLKPRPELAWLSWLCERQAGRPLGRPCHICVPSVWLRRG